MAGEVSGVWYGRSVHSGLPEGVEGFDVDRSAGVVSNRNTPSESMLPLGSYSNGPGGTEASASP